MIFNSVNVHVLLSMNVHKHTAKVNNVKFYKQVFRLHTKVRKTKGIAVLCQVRLTLFRLNGLLLISWP